MLISYIDFFIFIEWTYNRQTMVMRWSYSGQIMVILLSFNGQAMAILNLDS